MAGQTDEGAGSTDRRGRNIEDTGVVANFYHRRHRRDAEGFQFNTSMFDLYCKIPITRFQDGFFLDKPHTSSNYREHQFLTPLTERDGKGRSAYFIR